MILNVYDISIISNSVIMSINYEDIDITNIIEE